MDDKVKTAVFPIAGLGSRFLPATKAVPKEMLNLVDKPLIQYAVEEALEAGVEKFIFITSSKKFTIMSHLDKNYELEQRLQNAGKLDLYYDLINLGIPSHKMVFIQQEEPRGLGHAILCSKDTVGKNIDFFVILADDVYDGNFMPLVQMIQAREEYDLKSSHIIASEEVPYEDLHQYGCLDGEVFENSNGDVMRVTKLVEKPKKEDAPSNQAVAGRYLLNSSIFEQLEKEITGACGEIQLTDAIVEDMLIGRNVYAIKTQAKRFDCGSKEGFLGAVLHFSSKNKELKKVIENFKN